MSAVIWQFFWKVTFFFLFSVSSEEEARCSYVSLPFLLFSMLLLFRNSLDGWYYKNMLLKTWTSFVHSCSLRVQLNAAQDEIMKKKELLEDLQPDATQTCESTAWSDPWPLIFIFHALSGLSIQVTWPTRVFNLLSSQLETKTCLSS